MIGKLNQTNLQCEVEVEERSCKCNCLPTHNNKKHVNQEEEDKDECSWMDLPKDLLGYILSWTSVDDVIRCSSVCKDWESYINSKAFIELWEVTSSLHMQDLPWLFALSPYNCRHCCCAYNPLINKWYSIPLAFLPQSLKIPMASTGGLLLVKGSSTLCQHLTICNPITKQWRQLPPLHYPRSNSIVCVIETGSNSYDKYNGNDDCAGFQIIVAGGRSQDGSGYEATIEVYDSCRDSWHVVGKVPSEYAVRLAVWTPNDTVYCNGVIYCLTSARPYSIIAFDFVNGVWGEVMVPMPQLLLCSFLVQRRDRLTLVGGVGSPRDCRCLNVWELHNQGWLQIESMPGEVFDRFFRGKTDFDYKFAGSGDFLYFFRDSRSQMLVCELSLENQRATWRWIPGCSSVRSTFPKCSVRGIFIQPRLDDSYFR